ncbi:Nn.00g068100.m01.CDS01 [Neocucurbitaria sp. VM-36]
MSVSAGVWSAEQRNYLEGMESRIISHITTAIQDQGRTKPTETLDLTQLASQLVPLLVPSLKDAVLAILHSGDGGTTKAHSDIWRWNPNVASRYREPVTPHDHDDDGESEVSERQLPLHLSSNKKRSARRRSDIELYHLHNTQGIRILDLKGIESGPTGPQITPHIKNPVKYWDLVGQLVDKTSSNLFFATRTPLPECSDDECSQQSNGSFEANTTSMPHTELPTSSTPTAPSRPLTASIQSQKAPHTSTRLGLIKQSVLKDQISESLDEAHVPHEFQVSFSTSTSSTLPDAPEPSNISPVLSQNRSTITIVPGNQITNSIGDIVMGSVAETNVIETSTEQTTNKTATDYGQESVAPQASPESHTETHNDMMDNIQASGHAKVIEPLELVVHDERKDEIMAEAPQEAFATAPLLSEPSVVAKPVTISNTHQGRQDMSSLDQAIVTADTAPKQCLPMTTPVVGTISPPAEVRETTTSSQIKDVVETTPSPEDLQAKKTRELLDILAKARQCLMNSKIIAPYLPMMKLRWDDPSVRRTVVAFLTKNEKWGAGSLDEAISKARACIVEDGFFSPDKKALTLIWHCVFNWHVSHLEVLEPNRTRYLDPKRRKNGLRRLVVKFGNVNDELLLQSHPEGYMNWEEMKEIAQQKELAFFDNRTVIDIRSEHYTKYMDSQNDGVSKETVLEFITSRNGRQNAVANSQAAAPSAPASSNPPEDKKRTIDKTSEKDYGTASQENVKRFRNTAEQAQPRAMAGLKRRTERTAESSDEEAKMKRTRDM